MRKHILLGTTNQAKIKIVKVAIESLPINILTLHELNINISVREDGQSTEENAKKKARAYFAESHIPTLAIDGGLHVEDFPENKQPGIFIRRILSKDRDATDEELLDFYARELDKIGGESFGIWKGSIVIAISREEVYCDTFSFR